MSRKLEIFESVLTSPFNNDSFVGFVREFLNNVELIAPTRYNKEYSNFSFYVDGYYHIGNYISDDNDKIAIFSVCLNRGDTVERARSMQRNFVKPLIEKGGCAGALVAFFTKDEPDKWRLSFIRMDYEFSMGKVKEKLTPAKRYSYLVGKGEPCHTAKQRLYPIFMNDNTNPGIDELEEAFSVEKVTNEFFNLYKEKYIQLKKYLESNEEFMDEAIYRNFTSEQFVKKLMGQIVFLYFIQKKGWLGVAVWPKFLSEKEYNRVFYVEGASGRVIREYLPKLYAWIGEKYQFKGRSALEAIPRNVEKTIADNMVNQNNWGSGDKKFVRTLYDWSVSRNMNFFDDCLEPLFYDTLNKNRGEKAYCLFLHCRIPFMNGGLFEQMDNYEWENNNFAIPNELFSNEDIKGKRDADGILDIFDRYNFTVNEDEPMEREVAIDPEMLGKVFENLLEVKDRKSKGAFYTPREIVHYMCQETLINHLVTKTGISEGAIRDLILYGEYLRDEDTVKTLKVTDASGKSHYEFDKNKDLLISEEILCYKTGVNRVKEIDELLANVKVADLAVGSGAFPLGMLNEIVRTRQVLTEYLVIEMNGFQKKSFYAYDRKPYDLKVNTIKNCIFACDIEPSAVDVAKLRLWLSIVIDDEITENVGNGMFNEHTEPRQLPNLECNIICGNSLIDEFEGFPLITESVLLHNESENRQQNIFQKSVDGLISKLIELQNKLFSIKDHNEKVEIKKEIQKIYDDVILEQLQSNPDVVEDYYNTQSMSSKPFILWQLHFPKVFRDNGGFDIVIGNPPYGAKFSTKDKKILDKIYSGCNVPDYESADFFIELGHRLVTNQGELSFIIPNMFMANVFAEKYRKHLLDFWNIRIIDNLSDIDVFDAAKVRNCIVFLEKQQQSRDSIFTKLTIVDGLIQRTKEKMFSQEKLLDSIGNWLNIIEKDEIALSITKKMNTGSALLKEISEISQGLIPYDKYRGHSEEIIKNKIWNADYQKDETYRKELRGKDVERYKLTWNGIDWISYGEWLAAPRKPEFFKNERILIREITSPRILATYTNDEYYNTPSIINCINFTIDVYFVLGVINSELMSFYHNIMSPKANKGLFPKILVNDVRNIPIAIGDDVIIKEISTKVKDCLKNYSSITDAEIDNLVYRLYNITEKEIKYIKNWFLERDK